VNPSRLPLVPSDDNDPRLNNVFDKYRQNGGTVPDLYRILANSPPMLSAWVNMAWPLREDSTIDRSVRELVIMRVAQLTATNYEWAAHWGMARNVGVSVGKLTALRNWQSSALFTDAERDALVLADEITEALEVTDSTWAKVVARWSAGEIVELILTASFYSCVSRVLRTVQLPARLSPGVGSM
jgi:4-carboxymuconolactone decarboxylase